MNATEMGDLLGTMALFDNRKVGKLDVVAWLQVVGDLRYTDAVQAVYGHYGQTRERIMPADVRERVRALRAERLATTSLPPAPANLGSAEYVAWLKRENLRIADGDQQSLRAITGGAR